MPGIAGANGILGGDGAVHRGSHHRNPGSQRLHHRPRQALVTSVASASTLPLAYLVLRLSGGSPGSVTPVTIHADAALSVTAILVDLEVAAAEAPVAAVECPE